jgi:hypothetical protein
MIDPLISKTIACGFAGFFAFASWHKFHRHTEFMATLADYRVLPQPLVRPVSRLIPPVEAAIGLAWLLPATLQYAAYGSITLLLVYILAMAVNLARGRAYISCGCGLTDASASQPLSINLIGRNGVLIFLALIAILPLGQRVLTLLDYLTLAVALLASTLLYLAASQLSNNYTDMRGWMQNDD